MRWETHLINQSTAVNVVSYEDLSPKIKFAALNEVASLLLEHRVLVGDRNQFFITETLGISNICEIWIASLAEATDNERIVELCPNISTPSETV